MSFNVLNTKSLKKTNRLFLKITIYKNNYPPPIKTVLLQKNTNNLKKLYVYLSFFKHRKCKT